LVSLTCVYRSSTHVRIPTGWDAPTLPSLDLIRAGRLEFCAPEHERFPCLGLAYQALRTGGTMPCVLNAANEVGVEAFLAGRLRFTDIARVIAETMDAHEAVHVATLETVREVDRLGALVRDGRSRQGTIRPLRGSKCQSYISSSCSASSSSFTSWDISSLLDGWGSAS
jgi:hypothetical protein